MRTVHISGLGKCSSVILLIFLLTGKSSALTVRGIPEWLKPNVTRSLKAIWSEIPSDPAIDREGTLSLVAGRLFTGYSVDVKPELDVIFSSEAVRIFPETRINPPELRGKAIEWFRSDTLGMSEDVSRIVSEVPQNALTWAEEPLRKRISEIVMERLPGWEVMPQIYISQSSTIITLSFRPSHEMILAVKPELISRTIPAMFRSDLEARLIPELSLLIGLPVQWADRHRADIEEEARKFLEDRHAVENLQANVSVKFRADKVSGIEARADSKNIMFSIWVSAYAGIDGKYPEAGAFFGFRPLWRVNDRYNFAPEIYTELIFELEDFGFTQRIGGRFEFLNNFWGGIEYEMPDDEFYVRIEY
ncbi:MAG: hypothetical protein IJG36_10460, partial [Synergistaceae bacterium]|nr:hypothetical protein [Synergistaceae bacterium]